MGQTSSQMAASQAPTQTQDVPLTSQPPSQMPQLDGTQDDEPRTQERVDNSMEAIADTVKKAKNKKGKTATRTGRKSIPQHMRGHAIQPSQEILDTQEDVQADGGAVDEREGKPGAASEQQDSSQGIAVSQTTKPKNAKASRKQKRLHGDRDHVEPTVVNGHAEGASFNAINATIVKENNDEPSSKPNKRKRKDLELERLQKDAEDFAPDYESTPKPPPAVKRQKRLKTVKPQEVIEEQPERENSPRVVVPQSSAPERNEPAKHQPEEHATHRDDEAAEASNPQAKRKRAKKAREPRNTQQSTAEPSNTRSQPTQNAELDEADADDGHTAAQTITGVAGATQGDPNADSRMADGMPTPPESPGVATQSAVPGDGNGNVNTAQTDQQNAAPTQGTQQEGMPVTQETSKIKKPKKRKRAADETATSNPEKANHEESRDRDQGDAKKTRNERVKSKKRKSSDKVPDDDAAYDDDQEMNDEDHANADDTNEIEKKKTHKKPKKPKKQQADEVDYTKVSKEGRGEVSGTWSKEEKALADEIFDGVCRVTAVPPEELKVNTIDWRNPTPHLQQLKDELYEAFPKRDFKSIARFCQRRYNSYDRGKWTEDDDQRLREAYALNPDQWTAISDDVGRFWEDCRVRWRDVLSRTTKAETGPWSREEEKKLAEAVRECREIVVRETTDEEIRENPEKADALISWKVVAEKMGNMRVAKRCREKWAKIKHLDLSVDVPATAASQSTEGDKKPSKRIREIEYLYQQCDSGDIYDMLCEICTAVPDTSRVFEQETTFWSVVAVRNPESKFKSSLRRRAFWAALEEYSCKAVRDTETLAGKAHAAKERMERLAKKGRVQMLRSYVAPAKKVKKAKEGKGNEVNTAEVNGEAPPKKKQKKSKKPSAKEGEAINAELPHDRIKATQEQAHKPQPNKRDPHAKSGRFNYKSADIIVNSDDEGEQVEQVAETQQQPTAERQQTEERSLGDDNDPELHPSTFMELCTGKGKRIREKGKGKDGSRKRTRA